MNPNSYNSYQAYPNSNYCTPPNQNFCNKCNSTGSIYINGIIQPCICRSSISCNFCRGNGYLIDVYGMQQPCQCRSQNIVVITPHHKNIFEKIGDKFKALFSCSQCRGSGYIYSRNNRITYCPNCIKSIKYCPKCDNTGYKLKNGKRCNHSF